MILVTGGAGFIGSHLTDELVRRGYDVLCVDSLDKQVHESRPGYLNRKARYIFCDIFDVKKYRGYLLKSEVVFHLAARVGVGQSQYEIESYTKTNILGTAVILQQFVDSKQFPNKFVIAASMSSYGEGVYSCKKCGKVRPCARANASRNNWDPPCPKCRGRITPLQTPEDAPFQSNSVYALTKQVQEELVKNWGMTYKVPFVSLRFFNVFGPRQTLNNPYTGVVAIFINRVLVNKPPVIFEDGLQSRSFISVYDIVQGCMLALDSKDANNQVFNVGVDEVTTIADLAKTIIRISGKQLSPKITQQFRTGDTRHCTSDISRIKNLLGYKPRVDLETGLRELYREYEKESAIDRFDIAYKELKERHLVR